MAVISVISYAQDTIIKKNGDIIQAKISEIGTDEVKFKIFSAPDGPTIVLKKSELKKIRVGGQTVLDVKGDAGSISEDIIIKKNGETIKAKVIDIGTDEVRFKLYNDPDGPTISVRKSEIKTMKVEGQTVIDVKAGISEDIITKKDGSVLKTKIIELGTNDVRFKLYNNPDGPTMTMRKFDIKTIQIDGQIVYEYKEDPLSVTNHSILDKTSTLKFYFFSPLNHNLAFGYEWMDKPGFNWDLGLGIIGPGVTKPNSTISVTTTNPKGLFIRGGPKFLLGNSSDVEEGEGERKIRYSHPLKGRYIKVEMILNAFSTINTINNNLVYNSGPNITYKKSFQSVTLDLQYGRQFIYGNAMTLAWYAGMGYSYENKTSTLPSQYVNYDILNIARYSHSYFGETFPLVFTWGLTVGYIFKTPQMLSKSPKVTTGSLPAKHYKEGAQKQ